MVFSSMAFIFAFLPLALAAYHLAPARWRNAVLLAFSLLFYYVGEGDRLWVLALYMLVNHAAGRAIQVGRSAGTPQGAKRAKWAFVAALAFNLGLLVGYKYLGFFVSSLNQALAPWGLALPVPQIQLPIGISFFSFQAISYICDVYRGEVEAQASLISFSMYKGFFAQLIAGPIVRYKDVAGQIEGRLTSSAQFASGIQRFILGLAKKALIADALAPAADAAFAAASGGGLSCAGAWAGASCYALQIYFDFSGYSDMAIGLGRMFGFEFPENFLHPYAAASLRDFWRRWHVSLSTWFRDYVYLPLGGNRVAQPRQMANLAAVFLLCGLWHGAAFTFVLWGLWHGLFLMLERGPLGRALDAAPRPLRHAYTLLVVLLGWVLFRADSLSHAAQYLRAMALPNMGGALATAGLNLKVLIAALAGALASLPWASLPPDATLSQPGAPSSRILRGALLAALFAAAILEISSNTYSPFIYFRF